MIESRPNIFTVPMIVKSRNRFSMMTEDGVVAVGTNAVK